MNFTIEPSCISVESALQNVRFLEKKQNIIMPGEFTKIMYSVDILTMNGIYILCPLKCIDKQGVLQNSVVSRPFLGSSNKHMIWYQPNSVDNYDLLSYFRAFEKQLISQYLKHCELYSMYPNKNKTCVYTLSNQLSTGTIRVSRDFVGEDIDSIFLPKGERGKYTKSDYGSAKSANGSSIVSTSFTPIYAIKISGVWETATEIGITYKFIEMNVST